MQMAWELWEALFEIDEFIRRLTRGDLDAADGLRSASASLRSLATENECSSAKIDRNFHRNAGLLGDGH